MKKTNFENQARQRLLEEPRLMRHADTIFYDWPEWDEHMRWVATASVDEIMDWAETIESYDSGEE